MGLYQQWVHGRVKSCVVLSLWIVGHMHQIATIAYSFYRHFSQWNLGLSTVQGGQTQYITNGNVADLKLIYQATTEDEALLALDRFGDKWDAKYPQISRSWRAHWDNLNTLFSYPPDIRKAIYTTNAIEFVILHKRHAMNNHLKETI